MAAYCQEQSAFSALMLLVKQQSINQSISQRAYHNM